MKVSDCQEIINILAPYVMEMLELDACMINIKAITLKQLHKLHGASLGSIFGVTIHNDRMEPGEMYIYIVADKHKHKVDVIDTIIHELLHVLMWDLNETNEIPDYDKKRRSYNLYLSKSIYHQNKKSSITV